MTHKEFCIWLDGFLTNSDWTTIKENDIETIKRKLREVKNNDLIQHLNTSDNTELERLINLQNDINANNN
jgi:hypothetical protein